jgi:hypothetical protein
MNPLFLISLSRVSGLVVLKIRAEFSGIRSESVNASFDL